MKKKSLILSLIPALIFSVSSCRPAVDNSKIILDFGRVHASLGTTVEEIEYADLKKMVEDNESFIVAISDEGCGCWRDFQPHVAELNYKHQLNITHIDKGASGFLDEDFGLDTTTTGIAFFRDGKLARQVVYKSDSSNWNIFHKYTGLETLVNDNVIYPHVKLVSKDVLDSFISENREFNLYVGRHGCGDCSEINATNLKTWNKTTTVQDSLYYFDMEEYRGKPEYQTIKDEYGLSEESNPTFGYTDFWGSKGVFPTFQHRKGSTIEDMISILNDQADATNKTIVHSYFTAERVAAMPFLDGTGNQYILQGKELLDEDVDAETFNNWAKDAQLKYHAPIFEKFFETYFKLNKTGYASFLMVR